MGLLVLDTFLRRVSNRECVVSGKRLGVNETILSKAELPGLYDASKWTPNGMQLLKAVVSTLLEGRDAVLIDADNGSKIRQNVSWFFSYLLLQKEKVPEYCVHAYLFLFWSDIEYRNAFLPPNGEVFFTSKSLDYSIDQEQKYYPVLQRIKALVKVDLVAVSESTQHIFLIEIKRGPLDDRAVGQVLRYFNQINRLLTERVVRAFDLSYVRPILVLSEADKEFVEAFPVHFREILDIFEYSVSSSDDGSARVILSNLRKRFLSKSMV